MTDTKTKPKPAETQTPATAEALQATLYDAKADHGALAAARKSVSGMVAAGRPWEQLPARLKGAARADARRLLGDRSDAAILTDAGYGGGVAGQLMRDIGRA